MMRLWLTVPQGGVGVNLGGQNPPRVELTERELFTVPITQPVCREKKGQLERKGYQLTVDVENILQLAKDNPGTNANRPCRGGVARIKIEDGDFFERLHREKASSLHILTPGVPSCHHGKGICVVSHGPS
jgi:hypothetical protein